MTSAGEEQRACDAELAEFFAANRVAVRRFLVAAGCGEHEADDVVQDTILAVRLQWDRVRSLDKPAAYWFKAAIRRFRRLQGQRASHLASGDHHERLMAVPDPADAAAAVEDFLMLLSLLRELPPGQRQVLWLRRAAGFSEAETAEILDLRPGTVKSQLHDATARMSDLLRKQGETGEGGGRR